MSEPTTTFSRNTKTSFEVSKMLRKLEEMCRDLNFNKKEALELIKQIDINKEFETQNDFGFSYVTTLQAEAISSLNIRMLELLLGNGADPNQVYDKCESALWSLQYNYGENDEENEIRLKMAQMLLEYGANPNMNPDNEPEDLFQWVWFTLWEDGGNDLWFYRSKFFVLLVAYGGKESYLVPAIVKPFDKTKMEQYRFKFAGKDDKVLSRDYCAVIVDEKDEIVAYI